MNFEQFSELVLNRQACREFNGKKIDKQTLKKIAKLARLAPSACNSQPWTMYCVTDQSKIQEITEALTENGRNAFLKNATAYVAIGEKARALKPDITAKFTDGFFVKYDVGELIAYITLGAKAIGIDSCVIGYVNSEKMKASLSLLDGEECLIVVALGYSDIPTREKIRRAEDEVIKEI